mgnify:CR=1 FL=1
MVGVLGANDHDFAVSLDDFAFVAHRLDAGSDFHKNLLFVSVNDPALCQVVRRHLDFDSVAFQNSDVVDAEFSSEVCQYDMTVC